LSASICIPLYLRTRTFIVAIRMSQEGHEATLFHESSRVGDTPTRDKLWPFWLAAVGQSFNPAVRRASDTSAPVNVAGWQSDVAEALMSWAAGSAAKPWQST